MGGVGNGAAEEDGCWDLNPGLAAMEGGDHAALVTGPCGFGVLPFATWLRKQERPCWEEKGRKDSCWWAMRRCHMIWVNWRS